MLLQKLEISNHICTYIATRNNAPAKIAGEMLGAYLKERTGTNIHTCLVHCSANAYGKYLHLGEKGRVLVVEVFGKSRNNRDFSITEIIPIMFIEKFYSYIENIIDKIK